MVDNMDVDMDIDLDVDPEIAQLEAEAMNIEARSAAVNTSDSNGFVAPQHTDEPAPNKVYIRGLDNLTTGNIKQFAADYYPLDDFQRVEWIDDTSANLVYETSQAAAEALNALSDLPDGTAHQVAPLQLRKARPSSSHPDTELSIRQATLADIKAPRAHEKSRFYLMNPDHDPRERRRQYDDRRRGPRRDNNNRQRPEPSKPFDVNMYDDDTGDAPDVASYDDEDRRRDNRPRAPRAGDLFAGKNTGRLRDRSASPMRHADGDGRFGFGQDQPERRTARRRSTPPAPPVRDLFARTRASSGPKELFPDKGKTFGLDTPLTSTTSPKRSRELFPHKTSVSNHRRSDALDAAEGSQLRRSLADRITGPPNQGGFSIKGSAHADVPGFSIRGASREVNPVVKELFPSKMGNGVENDLFADKMKGRNTQRRRAEDMM